MEDFKLRFATVTQQLNDAAAQYHKPAPLLLAVGKKHPAQAIRALYSLGQRAFGESYAQEAIEKQQTLADLDIDWHFIGPIQSNKTKDIANHFNWVHSIDRLKIAKRLNEQRDPGLPPLNVCVQVNIDNEDSKAGVPPQEANNLCRDILAMPQLRLRGVMCIPKKQPTTAEQRQAFARIAALFEEIKTGAPHSFDTLSMGMTNDYQAAIAEGSTIVRIGTALFGERQ